MTESPPVFAPPGPGYWLLDPRHKVGGVLPVVQDISAYGTREGLRTMFATLAVPVDTLDGRFVHGVAYTRLRPLMNPDQAAAKMPPKFLIKAEIRVHPEMRRRAERAVANHAAPPIPGKLAEWHTTIKPQLAGALVALETIVLPQLTEALLAEHLSAVVAHCRASAALRQEFHGYGSVAATAIADDDALTVVRPLALLAGAFLDAGRRLHAQPGRGMLSALGRLFQPEHGYELTLDEAVGLLNGQLMPSGSILDRRAAERRDSVAVHPPATLGPAEAVLPAEVFPTALARLLHLAEQMRTDATCEPWSVAVSRVGWPTA